MRITSMDTLLKSYLRLDYNKLVQGIKKKDIFESIFTFNVATLCRKLFSVNLYKIRLADMIPFMSFKHFPESSKIDEVTIKKRQDSDN